MSESTNARNLATQQLEMLENELNGVHLDPSYGCPRVEYGSLFRHIMELRAEIATLRKQLTALRLVDTLARNSTDMTAIREAEKAAYACGAIEEANR